MTYHPTYVFGIGRWKSQAAHVFNVLFCIFDEYLHRMTLIRAKKSETTPQTQGKIIRNWECLGTLHARHPYEYTHAEPHDNQVLTMLVL